GGHILNLSRMNKVNGLSEADGEYHLFVQPGLLLVELREMLQNFDFETLNWSEESLDSLENLKADAPQFFPPDPTETSASMGGMAAANASGAQTFHYGPTSDYVMGLRVVLADGRTVAVRRGEHRAEGRHFEIACEDGSIIQGQVPEYTPPAVKSAAGYRTSPDMDLLDLFIGMEGTLGVITELEIALKKKPEIIWGLTAFMPDEASALKLVRHLRGESVDALGECDSPDAKPVAIEFFSGEAIDLLRKQKAENPAFSYIPELPETFHTALYIEFHGFGEEAVSEAAMSVAEAVAMLGGDEDAIWLAEDDKELERLKDFRHAVPESVNLLIDQRRREEPNLTKLGTDMSVPDEHLETIMQRYRTDLEECGLDFVVFGHIGNNHVHVNILPRTMADYEKGKELYLVWARAIVEMGGSVSAEHGIGKIKAPFLKMMYSEDELRQMQELKTLFDPKGILNPGNLFG
ncbi:MAG: FAD-binding oxidoreductase, partial [Candidatus Sumerlaeota bacterium]